MLDSFRQRLWRRALREHIEPVLSNSAKMETVIQVPSLLRDAYYRHNIAHSLNYYTAYTYENVYMNYINMFGMRVSHALRICVHECKYI